MTMQIYQGYLDDPSPNGWIMDPKSLDFEIGMPLDIKVAGSLAIIETHLRGHTYIDADGRQKSACWINTSRGKDSIVMEHLVFRALENIANDERRPLKIDNILHILTNTLNVYPEEIKYWKTFNRRYGLTAGKDFLEMRPPKDSQGKQITVDTIRKKNGQLEDFRGKPQKIKSEKTGNMITSTTPNCCFELKKKTLYKYLEEEGRHLSCAFTGLRAVESDVRRGRILRACRSYTTDYDRPREIRTCLPIGFWTDEDIHTYIEQNMMPLCPTYEKYDLERMGCRDCTGFKTWLVEDLKDPTGFKLNAARKNLEFMKKTEPERMYETIEYTIRQKEIHKLDFHKDANKVLDEFREQKTLEADYAR